MNKVRIGAIYYQVEYVPNLRDGDEPIDGQLAHDESAIKLESTLSPAAQRATLWHEVMHAILVHAGYERHDEGQLAALSYGIMQVLVDNPELRGEQ